ncbi:glycosyltransferase family 4 protein [Pedobacter sp. HDW13]|uniref:glycosyltransferase family 4 protein n=1 Tax=Pedobacter sp. HDW13 TaxID=2714940 RepID=UPI0014094956|nr:glycosyltransferase family 4 protein [Pedobacter sp. HDW13]QIL40662.1 glycosyltransferase family 4 protein [Pedobacter sp. HDW13]
MKRVLLITSGQPSLNPRLVKEADALADAGYHVTVLYQYWNAWGTALDEELFPKKEWKAIRVNGDPVKQKTVYWLTRGIHKAARKMIRLVGLNPTIVIFALSRGTYGLTNKAKTIVADLYIAHNLAALPAAVKAASIHRAKCGFDAEDMHRYETHSKDLNFRLVKFVEEKYFPKTDYLSTSSPQIAKKYQELFPALTFHPILNVFPKNSFTNRAASSQPLKLFWFSQNVGLSRGLQDAIRSLKILEGFKIEFHILGFLSNTVKIVLDELIQSLAFANPPRINFHQPIASSKLAEFASQFNIGLATEPGFSINNHLALSNKLFTYLQAGLATVVTETIAQKEFINDHPSIGASYEIGNVQQLAEILLNYIQNPALLVQHQNEAYHLFEATLNWDEESEKFIAIVNKTLN